MLGRFWKKNQSGFTLIELMTVVAIMGTLAALGVPQYRKFQRKSRRAEANMMLGVIASAQSAFNAEYNTFGNNLPGIGAEFEQRPKAYSVGFFSSTTCASAPTLFPNTVNNYPGYGTTGFTNSATLGTTANTATYVVPTSGTAPGACIVGSVSATNYTISASGALGGASNDQMTMNETRTINVVTDGT